jgi:hypothetical protein
MAENHIPGSSDVGARYDRMSEVLMEALGDNIHHGFWDDDNDDTPVREATDRLTEVIQDFFLATDPTPRDLEALTAIWNIFEFSPFGTEKDFEHDIAAAGLDLISFEDITTNVRRTMRLVIATLRSKVDDSAIEKEVRGFLASLVEILKQLMASGTIQHSLITTCRR